MYHVTPYHCFFHCMDVAHTTFRLIDLCQYRTQLTAAERFALMIAAVAHDIDHPGSPRTS